MHWQILRWPFRIPALFSVALYAFVAFAFTAFAQMNYWVGVLVLSLGLPVWYAVLGQLSIYADKLLTQAAYGLFDEHFESEAELNPFTQGVGLKYFIAHGIVFLIFFYNGPELKGLLLIPALLFPLIWLGVVLDDSLSSNFQPARTMQILGGLHIYYLAAVLLSSGAVGYLHYSLLYASSLLNIIASAFGFLFGNALLGLLLYWRRRELGLYTKKSPEQALAEELEAEQREIDQLFHELHTHTANGSFGTAIAKLEAYIGRDTRVLDPLMHQRLLAFQDQRLCLEHAVRYLARLVAQEEERKAWALMKECLAMDERFRPPVGETLLALTRAAGREDAGLVNDLLGEFADTYPDSPLIADAQFRRARVCIEILRDGEAGLKLLNGIAADYPDFAAGETFKRYRRRLKIR